MPALNAYMTPGKAFSFAVPALTTGYASDPYGDEFSLFHLS